MEKPLQIKNNPKGFRNRDTSTVNATKAVSAAASVPGSAVRTQTVLSIRPFFRWKYRLIAAAGRKNSKLIACAVRCSTPRNSVMHRRSIVPPPTPQPERIPVSIAVRKGRKNVFTADTSHHHREETVQKSAEAHEPALFQMSVRRSLRPQHPPEDRAARS